jgi:plastocyanin
MRRILFGLALLSLGLMVLVPLPAHASTPSPGANFVQIVNFAFMPSTITVHTGFVVTWKNMTLDTQHTTTSDNNVWDSGVLNPGQSFSFTFTTPGTYTYHCNIHPFMKGTIIVQ